MKMAKYELMLVIDPFLEEADTQAMVEKAQDQIKRFGGDVTQVDPWGKRRLAYPINKKLEGHYSLFTFEGTLDGAAIADIERNLRLDEKVMRVMVTRVPAAKAPKARKKGEAEGSRAQGDTLSAGQAGQPQR